MPARFILFNMHKLDYNWYSSHENLTRVWNIHRLGDLSTLWELVFVQTAAFFLLQRIDFSYYDLFKQLHM